jgi:glutathione peroxidase
MKFIILGMLLSTLLAGSKNIYQFKVDGIDGKQIAFEDYKGKYILVVNTASNCGYTPQYEGLEALYNAHKDKLVVIGFPANNFGGQEPGSNEEIKTFCKKNYGVTFPMAKKISVKGSDQHALYKWLCSKAENGVSNNDVKWNFTKFLIDKEGNLVKMFGSSVSPNDEAIVGLLK